MKEVLLLLVGGAVGAGGYYLGEHSESQRFVRDHYEQMLSLQRVADREHESYAKCLQHRFDACAPNEFSGMEDLRKK